MFFEAGTSERIESTILIDRNEHKDLGPGRGQSWIIGLQLAQRSGNITKFQSR